MGNTLGKDKKLKSKKLIESLFVSGKRIKSFPLVLIYLKQQHEGAFPIKVALSVPKKNIKSAVKRNRYKRRMREVYRKNIQSISQEMSDQYIGMLLYTAKEELTYDELDMSIKKLLKDFLTKISHNEKEN